MTVFDEAMRQAKVWEVVGLNYIPTEELSNVFQRALADYDPSQPFGAAQIRSAWEAMRQDRAAATEVRSIREQDQRRRSNAMVCYLCQDSGWQSIAYINPESGNENTQARPCGCTAGEKPLIAHIAVDWMRKHRVGKLPKDWAPDPAIIAAHRPVTPPDWRKRPATEIWERAIGPGDK